MPLRVSTMELKRASDTIGRLKQRMESLRDKAGGVVETLVRTSEVGASAFAMGIINGKTGGIDVVGVPLELGAAVALHGLAFLGLGGKLSGHLHNFGDGALACYLASLGSDIGEDMDKKGGAKMKGSLEEGRRGRRLSESELDELVRARASAAPAAPAGA